jgi:hypothetical protein
MSQDVARLVPGRSDVEVAEELKLELVEAAKPLLEVLNKTNENKFGVGIILERDGFGSLRIRFHLSREF